MITQYIYFAIALLGIIFFLFLIKKLFKWLQSKISKLENNIFFSNTKFAQFFRFITPRRERHILSFFLRLLRITISITFLILYLPFLFSLVPQTKKYADIVIGYIKKPLLFLYEGLIGFIPNLFFIVVIFFVTKYLLKFLKYVTTELEREAVRLDGFHADWARPTFNLLRVVIIAFALIIVFPYIPGSDSPAFKGVSIFFGILFSLGSTSAISNIVAGIVITYMRPFKVGDRVKIGDTIGDITERSLLVTRVKTIKNLDITIPNSSILGNHITNFTKNAEDVGIILHTSVTIGYDVTGNDVVKALIEGAKKTDLILSDPVPFVLIKSLDDFYVNYEINVYTKNPEKSALIYSMLHENLKGELHHAGIEILSPHYQAIRDGNVLTVPPENIPQNYIKPGFKVN
ncbi:mechanosensitive ion channel family protein [Aquimarina sp. AD10]|uniref:mechanosensitive ion channel family protein n=1 Tax=Aquimarina sp. AD10 TaxID=1714849 RepID=UPI000E522C7C|nr:mechanosensitive ion channel domain-containing protein [Aquimarina sp. AD10]AXT61461.1 mechanosensitive ion channel family protein [Aquimarina sp. AD10]RKM89945.1 mechanosensitive ion channel family protein [Aquimarina sp. AD10]